ncbi:hypothetical protein AURDEDRAFT_166604 [Auricularia subglabra TFB-10046 SS5]|nr:hypothetical protein AURDEDRAFT_166604 [Auricularia subglabra TFB-10046 SS5]
MHHISALEIHCPTSRELLAVAEQLVQPAPILTELTLAVSQDREPAPYDDAVLSVSLFDGISPVLTSATIVGLRIPATCPALAKVTRLMLIPPPPERTISPICLTDVMPCIDNLGVTLYPHSPQYTLAETHTIQTLTIFDSGNSEHVSYGEMRPHLASLDEVARIPHISVSDANKSTARTLLDSLGSQPVEQIAIRHDEDGHHLGLVEAAFYSENGGRSRCCMGLPKLALRDLLRERRNLTEYLRQLHCVDSALQFFERVRFPRLESLEIGIRRGLLRPNEYSAILSNMLLDDRTPKLHMLQLSAEPRDDETYISLDGYRLIAALRGRGNLRCLRVDGIVLTGWVENELVSLVDDVDVVVLDSSSIPQRFHKLYVRDNA